MGRLLLSYRYEANIFGGIVIIIFGLFMTGLVRVPWFQRDVRYHGKFKGARPITAFGLGLAFAFGWTPCIGPILGTILTVSAVSTNSFNGIALLSIYSMGLAVPFLLVAVFTGAYLSRAHTLRRIGRPLQIAAGVVMIVMGIAMVTGYLTTFSFWLDTPLPWKNHRSQTNHRVWSRPGIRVWLDTVYRADSWDNFDRLRSIY